jgi:hypothetical protein
VPQQLVRWHFANIPVSTNFASAAREHANGRSSDETLATIDQANSFVFIQHIEEDPEYRALVQEIIGSVAPTIERIDPGIRAVHGWLFVSSPGAVTPYHMDHETNFLLQIRGSKRISVWDPQDRGVLSTEQLEAFHANWSLAETSWREELETKAHVTEARPGSGVFMPYTAPHAVKNGPDISITLSITFLTERNQREQDLFAANYRLRRLGLRPRPIGVSPVLDEAKLHALHALQNARGLALRARRLLGREAAPPAPSRY